MDRRIINALIVPNSLAWVDNPISTIFEHTRRSGDYDMILFPFTDEKNYTEVIVFDYKFLARLKDLEIIKEVTHDEESLYFDFRLPGIKEEDFFIHLREAHCEVHKHYLPLSETEVSKVF